MRKNVNKLVAFAIGISVMSGSIVPVFAADAKQSTGNVVYTQNQVKLKPVLTLKEAIDAAVDNSDNLALKSKQIKLYEDQLDIQDELDDFQDSDNDFPYDRLEILVKQSKEQKDFMKDQIAQDITDKYNDLVTKENALEKLNKQIEIKTKQLKDNELKKKLGMITSIDMQSAEIELQTLKNSKKAKEEQLKNNQDYFKILTNKDLSQYLLEQDQNYEVFKINGSVDEYMDKVIDKYLKYNEKILDLTKDNLKDNEVDKPDSSDVPNEDDYTDTIDNGDGTTTKKFDEAGYKAASQEYVSKWTTYGQYLQNKYDLSSGKVTLDESKKSLKDGLKQSYTSLLDMENNINVLKANIEVNNKQLSIAKLKYDAGLITKTDYDNQVLTSKDLETNLRTLINNYNSLKNKIQKPWLLSSGSSSVNSGA